MTRREREITDIAEMVEILNNSKVLHLGLVDKGMPYIVPMNYGYEMDEGRLTIYLHGAYKGYKMDVIKQNPVCCFEMECGLAPFEGDIACRYGMIYQSLMGRGEIKIIDDMQEKKKALKLLMLEQTGKDFEFSDPMANAVCVMRIDVSEYTAKHRPMPQK